MVLADRLLRGELPVDHPAHVADHLEGRFGELDLAAEQGHPGAVALRVREELEGIPVGAGRPAEDPDHELRVVGAELGHRPWAVVGDLEEEGPLRPGEPREAAQDGVPDIGAGLLERVEPRLHVGVEHLEEVAHRGSLRVLAEGGERLEAPDVVLDTVVEGDRVQAQIAAEVARPGERGGAERPRGLGRIDPAPHPPDVRRFVGADGGGDPGALENPRSEALQGRARDEHHVDDPLPGDGPDLVEVAREGPVRVEGAPVRATLRAGGGAPSAHVGVLRVRDDEVGPRGAPPEDCAELPIECLHVVSGSFGGTRPALPRVGP